MKKPQRCEPSLTELQRSRAPFAIWPTNWNRRLPNWSATKAAHLLRASLDASFRRSPTETLLKTLAGYNGAFERIDTAMQDIVDILREREVSWATVGRALAVSRQAAWKRFG